MLHNYMLLFDFMEILGKKWVVPLLLLLLLAEQTNFSHMKRQLRITSRALSKKLQLLEAVGLVQKIVLDNPKKIYYTLSIKGKEVSQAVTQLSTYLA
ncbi:winged helix-turn-helix transcriptional regulator [Candidatus Woesearchaeota archaeon]|nr:winged helix-turn-helix transcriptional regulator [Candidatus Woesearchaeota archaeon]